MRVPIATFVLAGNGGAAHHLDMSTSLPFARVLVPYDGSEPGRASLALALTLAQAGAHLTLLSVADDRAAIAQAALGGTVFDPAPVLEALDLHSRGVLDRGIAQCREAGVHATAEIIHNSPVGGVLATIAAIGADLVIMGTHARTGVARTFIGSTTEGVLRASTVPVLTIRADDQIGAQPFGDILVAVDDSTPADAAVAIAARLAKTTSAHVVAVCAVDSAHVAERASAIGLDAQPIADEEHHDAAAILRRAFAHAGLPKDTRALIRDGKPADVVLAAANELDVSLIVTGTHGRRGIRRLMLGSVAESIVRASHVPVLVVPATSG